MIMVLTCFKFQQRLNSTTISIIVWSLAIEHPNFQRKIKGKCTLSSVDSICVSLQTMFLSCSPRVICWVWSTHSTHYGSSGCQWQVSEFNDVFVQYWNAELEPGEWNHPSDRLRKKLLAAEAATRTWYAQLTRMGEEWWIIYWWWLWWTFSLTAPSKMIMVFRKNGEIGKYVQLTWTQNICVGDWRAYQNS